MSHIIPIVLLLYSNHDNIIYNTLSVAVSVVVSVVRARETIESDEQLLAVPTIIIIVIICTRFPQLITHNDELPAKVACILYDRKGVRMREKERVRKSDR